MSRKRDVYVFISVEAEKATYNETAQLSKQRAAGGIKKKKKRKFPKLLD